MTRNPYIKQHRDFCAWIERATMPPELLAAAERFRCELWAAAHNPEPLPSLAAEVKTWTSAYAQSAALVPCEHRH